MSLQPGRRLAHYEIAESIGKGGMGEVYRARDTKLERDVAIKVLPEEFTRDRERLERFEREARLLAQLNHTNIATLHGLEESDGVQFLVMELVEGETLHERIARGRMPADEAIPLFIQIADGLEAAHAKGIIHRDLKPANIKITTDGDIKILDFGLARAVGSKEIGQSESPTMTRGTADGVILGTAPYMSPEQARGKTADAQTDVWAFGCCLYEALTGRAAFLGETVSDTLARVIERDPDWQRLSAATPIGVRTLLSRALTKDKRHRLHHIADARLELETKHDVVPRPVSRVNGYKLLAIAASFVAVALLVNAFRRAPVVPVVTRAFIDVAPSESFSRGYFSPSVALSPNGRFVAYVGGGNTTGLYLRATDQFDATTVSGSRGAEAPFFSPDSEWLAFWENGNLMKVSVRGGAPVVIASMGRLRGASWGSDGMIVLARASGSGLQRISSDGGAPEAFVNPDRAKREKGYRLPHVLPGSAAVLFTLATGDVESFDDAAIAVFSPDTGETKILLAGGTNPRYSPSGHVVFARAGRLWSVPFDLVALRVSGSPVAVVDDVAMSSVRSGPADYDISLSGDLVYAPGGSWGANRRVTWVDRQGNSEVLVRGPGPFGAPRISSDGKLITLFTDGANASVWIYDRARTTLTRLASGFDNAYPIWTPDGARVTYGSNAEGGAFYLAWKPADGSEESQIISRGPRGRTPRSWSPDGTLLAFIIERDIWIQSVGGDDEARELLAEPYEEKDPAISPNGEWIAYTSNESGQDEVYLRAFPELGAKFRVSTDGGARPRWPSNGRELFYWNVDRMMVVDIAQGGEPVGIPRVLFQAGDRTAFLANFPEDGGHDVAPDGQHFVMIEQTEPDPSPKHLNLVTNWASELERLVPAGR